MEQEPADISQIIPHLYLGNCQSSIHEPSLRKNNITSMISILDKFLPAWEHPSITHHVPLPHHLLIPADDNPAMNLLAHFTDICDFIDSQISQRRNTLVHCRAAVSRSPVIVFTYLIRRQNKTLDDIYDDFCDKKRDITFPVLNHLEQLRIWGATGYWIWEDGERRVPKGAYRGYLKYVRPMALENMGCGWKGDEPGLAVVGIGDVRKTTWEEGKEGMLAIDGEKCWVRSRHEFRSVVNMIDGESNSHVVVLMS